MAPTEPVSQPPAGAGSASGATRRRIGRYEVLEFLGQGSMGVVYAARDGVLHREVALKVMAAALARDPKLTARFEREARAAARIVHPCVVTLHDLGHDADGSPYVVMELLKGRDLRMALAAPEPIPLARRLWIVVQILSGLSRAHRAGIVHRDIKPANVFLTNEGGVKILDFGLARLLEGTATGTEGIMGTAHYMSPEQLRGLRVDARSDLFSCGCVLFELATGDPPFLGENLVSVAYRIVHEEPDYGLLPAGAVYAALGPILKRALAKDPVERYASADAFARELAPLANVDAPAAAQATLDLRLAPPLPTLLPEPRRPGFAWRRAAAPGLAGALAIAGAVLGYRSLADPSSGPAPAGEPAPVAVAPPSAAPAASLAPRPATSASVAPARPRETSGPVARRSPATPASEPAVAPAIVAPPATTEAAPEAGPIASVAAPEPVRLIEGRWKGYLTDASCRERGAIQDHWECVRICMRRGHRPLLYVEGKLYEIVGIERIRGDRNREIVVEGSLDPATGTITVSGA